MLALNALIELRAPARFGAGFAVWRRKSRSVGQKVETIARELETQLTGRTANLAHSIQEMTERSRGMNAWSISHSTPIELIDRRPL